MSDLYRRCEVGTRLRSRPHPDAFWSDKYGWLEEVTEPLLTREEAANDPEVQRTVFDNWQVRQAWMFTNSQVRRTREVTDDE